MAEPMLFLGGPAHGRLWRNRTNMVRIPLLPEQMVAEPNPELSEIPLEAVEYRAGQVYSAATYPPVVVTVLVRAQDEDRAADLLFDHLMREWVKGHG